MKSILPLLFIAFVPLLAACGGNEAPKPLENDSCAVTIPDSDAFVIAVVPTLDALPIYYAESRDMFNGTPLPVHIKTYQAGFDADTALLRRHADMLLTDLVRVSYYQSQHHPLHAEFATDGAMSLVVCGKLRINDIPTLRRRLVGVARHSASDYWSEQALKKSGMDYHAIFRPQINDYRLRTTMLDEDQVDAAILPEPYTTAARMAGHHLLYTSTDSATMGCFAVQLRPDRAIVRDSVLKSVIRIYNQAVDSINIRGKEACRSLLTGIYRLSPAVADSLRLPHYRHAAPPTEERIRAARQFLKEHP